MIPGLIVRFKYYSKIHFPGRVQAMWRQCAGNVQAMCRQCGTKDAAKSAKIRKDRGNQAIYFDKTNCSRENRSLVKSVLWLNKIHEPGGWDIKKASSLFLYQPKPIHLLTRCFLLKSHSSCLRTSASLVWWQGTPGYIHVPNFKGPCFAPVLHLIIHIFLLFLFAGKARRH